MKRRLPNWLEAYEEYTYETESNPLFNKWVGISTIASALRKKVWLELGRLRVYPNLYIVLVAEPGVARKSQAINYAIDLVSEVPSIVLSSDSVTAPSLMEELEEATTYDRLPDDSALRHASLSVFSKEFESFLNGCSNKMIITLTDLFDAGEKPWKHRLKSTGTSTIPSVFLNILGATTPRSLTESLSGLALEGGLSSRIIFVHATEKHKKVAVPEMTPRVLELRRDLIHDLDLISQTAGNFQYEKDALKYWKEWYESYEEGSSERIQPRKEFDGWYSRKPLLLQKISIILAASGGEGNTLTLKNLNDSIQMIETVESGMGIILPVYEIKVEVENTKHQDLIFKYIKHYKKISEKHLLQLIWRDVSEDNFDQHMDKLLKKGEVERGFEEQNGVESIWYYLKEKENES